MKVSILYFRSLYSQSASSLSSAKFSADLLSKGYDTYINLLSKTDYYKNLDGFKNLEQADIIVYKTNFKDFEIGINIVKNLWEKDNSRPIYLAGPFALLNEQSIVEKYPFIKAIINFERPETYSKYFEIIGEPINKPTLIAGVDRQIEHQEKGYYVNLESGSGCVNKCNFCHINLLGYPFRIYDVKNVVDEMEQLNKKLGKRYFIFNDSIFYRGSADRKRILDFCEEIKKRNLHIYFYIYLSLYPMIPQDLLMALKEVGLIRVFFGIESVTQDFQENNPKKVTSDSSDNFMQLLKDNNISYHIGFMLFHPDEKYESVLINLKYLLKINKMHRIGVILEKMRIVPKSPNCDILEYNPTQIDQAYNYHFKYQNTEQLFNLYNAFFKNIDIRSFEQFFTGFDIARTVLVREGKQQKYATEIQTTLDLLTQVNQELYALCEYIYNNKTFDGAHKDRLLKLYAVAQMNYCGFIDKLKAQDFEIFNMLPHGKEELNI